MTRKKLAVAVILLAVAGVTHGADGPQYEVQVRVFGADSVIHRTLIESEAVAAEILASAGVRLRWANLLSKRATESPTGSCGTSGSFQTIDLRFLYSTPADRKPGALAEAFINPRSTIGITVFFDRVAIVFEARRKSKSRILGHILAHEISHLLLRIDSHSETGLMKTHCDIYDFTLMEANNLSFIPENANLIRSNLARACPPPMPR